MSEEQKVLDLRRSTNIKFITIMIVFIIVFTCLLGAIIQQAIDVRNMQNKLKGVNFETTQLQDYDAYFDSTDYQSIYVEYGNQPGVYARRLYVKNNMVWFETFDGESRYTFLYDCIISIKYKA